MVTRTFAAALTTALLAPGLSAQSYVNFEGAPTHPIALSQDGSRMFAVNIPDNKLEVYDLADPTEPVLLRVIPVGLEPISVNVRSNDVAWVVNTVSDSISIVSVREGRVTDTIKLKDEPADVVFAGTPERAFITTSASDEVHVYDVGTLAFEQKIAINGKDPRAMVVDGSSVYVLVRRSGNGTTILPESVAPPQPPPDNPIDPAPQTSKVIDADDAAWAAHIPYDVGDVDLVEIDADTLSIVREISGVGTNNYNLAVHPTTHEVWVVQTDARNTIPFENVLKGHSVDSMVTIVGTGPNPTITKIDLNPGVDYNLFPNPTALFDSLADPAAILIDAAADRVYVAAQGTDRIGILNGAGTITDRIEVGETDGTFVQPRAKRGPRGIVQHPTAPILYLYNRLHNSITQFDTVTKSKGDEIRLSFNPTPTVMHIGRKYIYDAKLSSNGTQSCAGCHIDAETDGMAWDLGLTDGQIETAPVQPFPFDQANNPISDFHPMKGPLMTQTLRGLGGLDPFHWRGDRPDLDSFNAGFTGILAGDALAQDAMDLVVAWMDAVAFHPNPNRLLDDSLATTPANANQAAGFTAFHQDVGGGLSCASCHDDTNGGSNGMIISKTFLQEAQDMKTPHLRELYRKTGFTNAVGTSKTGFGYTHDGALDDLTDFLALPQFNPWPAGTKDDIVEFLIAFDTGTKPTVGWSVPVGPGNAQSAGVTTKLGILETAAQAGQCDTVVKGTLDGRQHGLVYDPVGAVYVADRSDLGPYTTQDLRDLVSDDRAFWVWMGVPPGSGDRIGIDRDNDGTGDAEDGTSVTGAPSVGCNGTLHIYANREPEVNTNGFALVVVNAPPSSTGVMIVNPVPTRGAGTPTPMRVSPGPIFSYRPITSDAEGFAYATFPIPDNESLAGESFVGVAYFDDACGGFLTTERISITVQP